MRTNIKSIFIASVLTVTLAGCSKFGEFGDINLSPNSPSNPNAGMLFTRACMYVPNFIMTSTSYDPWMQLWTGYIAETMNNQFGSLTSTVQYATGSTYLGAVEQMNRIIRLNQDEKTKDELYVSSFGSTANQIAVATTLKAYFMMSLTDIVGPMPYSEASRGNSDDIWKPKFDSIQEIYTALDKELSDVYGQFDTSSSMDKAQEVLYGGDVSKWKKFNATLRMMMAIKLSDVDPATGKARFAKAYADGGMTAVADGFNYTFSEGDFSWFYYIGNKDYKTRNTRFGPNKFFVEALKEYKDPRLFKYFTLNGYLGNQPGDPTDFNAYKGITLGHSTNNPVVEEAAAACSVADAYCEPKATYGVITTARTLLVEAEAAVRGWISADAATLYAAGIRASFEFCGAKGADEYIAAHPLPSDSQKAIEEIAMQRWFAGFLTHGVEAWSDWRRLNVPKLPLTSHQKSSTGQKTYPVRLGYGTGDTNANKENADEAVKTYFGGNDTAWQRLWWDVADND